jgi:hypothetical protein
MKKVISYFFLKIPTVILIILILYPIETKTGRYSGYIRPFSFAIDLLSMSCYGT